MAVSDRCCRDFLTGHSCHTVDVLITSRTDYEGALTRVAGSRAEMRWPHWVIPTAARLLGEFFYFFWFFWCFFFFFFCFFFFLFICWFVSLVAELAAIIAERAAGNQFFVTRKRRSSGVGAARERLTGRSLCYLFRGGCRLAQRAGYGAG